jgi:hypothetical protein
MAHGMLVGAAAAPSGPPPDGPDGADQQPSHHRRWRAVPMNACYLDTVIRAGVATAIRFPSRSNIRSVIR